MEKRRKKETKKGIHKEIKRDKRKNRKINFTLHSLREFSSIFSE